jgi:hypothetical protein
MSNLNKLNSDETNALRELADGGSISLADAIAEYQALVEFEEFAAQHFYTNYKTEGWVS